MSEVIDERATEGVEEEPIHDGAADGVAETVIAYPLPPVAESNSQDSAATETGDAADRDSEAVTSDGAGDDSAEVTASDSIVETAAPEAQVVEEGDTAEEGGERAADIPVEAKIATGGVRHWISAHTPGALIAARNARIAEDRSRAAELRALAVHHDALVKAHASEEESVAKEASARLSDHLATPQEHAEMMQTVRSERAAQREADRIAAEAQAAAEQAERQRQEALGHAGQLEAEASRLQQEAGVHAHQVQIASEAHRVARDAAVAAAAAMEAAAFEGKRAQHAYDETTAHANSLLAQAAAIRSANQPAVAEPKVVPVTA